MNFFLAGDGSSVFPNPMYDAAHIYFSNPDRENYSFALTDVTGKAVMPGKNIFTGDILIERKNLSSGIYFYTIRNNDNTKMIRGKIVIE